MRLPSYRFSPQGVARPVGRAPCARDHTLSGSSARSRCFLFLFLQCNPQSADENGEVYVKI